MEKNERKAERVRLWKTKARRPLNRLCANGRPNIPGVSQCFDHSHKERKTKVSKVRDFWGLRAAQRKMDCGQDPRQVNQRERVAELDDQDGCARRKTSVFDLQCIFDPFHSDESSCLQTEVTKEEVSQKRHVWQRLQHKFVFRRGGHQIADVLKSARRKLIQPESWQARWLFWID